MVFSAVYPMAFDEDFHFGLIRIYGDHWSPFLNSQPAQGDAYGAVARDPSYLYHYLMSFPYRLLKALSFNQTAQIIILRVINVAMVAYSLVLFRKIMQRATKSAGLTNVTMAIFALIPIVPQLAAHINYDNLVLLLMAWVCLLVYRLIDEFKAKTINLKTLLLLANVSILACLVKYAFLPIAAATAGFVLYFGYRQLRSVPVVFSAIKSGFRALSRPLLIGLTLLTVLSAGLFVQRFGVNVVTYHNPIADCGDVLSYDNCKAYGPWIRNYHLSHVQNMPSTNFFVYMYDWFTGLWFRLFFAINGPTSHYNNYWPLPLPYIAAAVVIVSGFILMLRRARSILADPFALFSTLVVVLYCGALWYEEYGQYLETGQPVAINGRYLIPVIFLIAILLGRGYQLALATRQTTKTVLATLAVLFFLHGGGLMTFILRSDASWDWPNQTVVHVNNAARKVLSPLIFEGPRYPWQRS